MVKVSVILPVHNHARWVRQALASILGQSLPVFELVVIDDASTDASWQEVQAFVNAPAVKASIPNITCLRHADNCGAPATLNQALQLAQGDYLAILNSDDVWEAQRLARLLAVMQEQQWDFVASDVFLLDADGQPKERHEPHWTAWFNNLKADLASHQDLWATLLHGNMFISTSNFVMHRRVYAQVGGFAELRYVHDYDYVLRVMAAGFKVGFCAEEKLLGYRLHGYNTIREKPLAAIEENMHMLLGWLPQLAQSMTPRRLQGLQAQLLELYRYTREEWQTHVHERLVAKEQELFPLIADRDRWVAERDGWIADRDAWIAERDTIIHGLQQQVAQQQQWVADRDHWIAERDGWIAERDGWIAERDGWIAERDGWIAERDQAIAGLQQQVQQQQAWLAERDVAIQRLHQQLGAVYGSRAFRLGEALLRPLRRCRMWLGQQGEGYA